VSNAVLKLLFFILKNRGNFLQLLRGFCCCFSTLKQQQVAGVFSEGWGNPKPV
jgi:hypothetical protein